MNQNGGSRTDTLIKLVLVFFLSLLSFSVGTFVGKQFSDSQHRVAELEEDTDRVVASVPTDLKEDKHDQVISEEEISKLSDEFVKKEKEDPAKNSADKKMAPTTGAPAPAKSAEKKVDAASVTKEAKKTNVHDEISEISKKIAAGIKEDSATPKAPTVAKTNRIPSSLPKEVVGSTIGKFTVQLSSLPTEDDAKTKAQEFRDKGYSAFYVPATVSGKTWYRVNVGQFETAKEAKEYKAKLAKDSSFASAIVQKISP